MDSHSPRNGYRHVVGDGYVLITEDSPQLPLIDWDFLNNYTVGFDADHMPEGADVRENFKDYVLGTYDGIPKTPEWASEICGVSPQKIRSFAIEYATTKPTAIICGGSTTRSHRAEHTAQAYITLACMTGNIGIPGAGVGLSVHNRAGNAGPPLVRAGSSGVPSIDNPLKDVRINQNELWEACLSGKYTAGKDDIRNIDIRMVYFEGMSVLNQKPGAVKGIKAMREKFEFVVTNAYNLTTQAKFSDIVLPVTTPWEKFGSFGSGNREALFYYTKAIEPWYNQKTTSGWLRKWAKEDLIPADRSCPSTAGLQRWPGPGGDAGWFRMEKLRPLRRILKNGGGRYNRAALHQGVCGKGLLSGPRLGIIMGLRNLRTTEMTRKYPGQRPAK